MEDFPHDGYCGRQFERMLNGSRSAVLEVAGLPHRPVIDIASSYKNARREIMKIDRYDLMRDMLREYLETNKGG